MSPTTPMSRFGQNALGVENPSRSPKQGQKIEIEEINQFAQLNGEKVVYEDIIRGNSIRIKGNVEITSQSVILASISIFKAFKMLKDDFEDIRRNKSSILDIENKRASFKQNQRRPKGFTKSVVYGDRRKRAGIAIGGLPNFRAARHRTSITPKRKLSIHSGTYNGNSPGVSQIGGSFIEYTGPRVQDMSTIMKTGEDYLGDETVRVGYSIDPRGNKQKTVYFVREIKKAIIEENNF